MRTGGSRGPRRLPSRPPPESSRTVPRLHCLRSARLIQSSTLAYSFIQPPQWLADAISVLQPKWPNDKFEVILREANPCSPAWRVKCLDCPGKLYVPGPGETLSNFEVHLKNRMHRQRADDRMVAATPLPAAEGAGADAEVPAESAKAIVISKIVCVVACTSYVASQFYSSGVVSLEKPLLANVAAMLLYLLRGLEVIFVGFLVLLFAACIQKMRAAAPASPPVLFDDGAATAAEVAAAVEEKGNKDAENASA
ncbi:hypothetical protein FB451DRAFT_1035354 [Mycena latifolia]|nr:hypothetical protein FB451DRAFT_1035354 [Mycena latifolia]